MAIKISKSFWDGCNDNERQYISRFASRIGVMDCKEVIREARKQLKGKYYQHIGPYYLLVDGVGYNYTGNDTKRFKEAIQ